MTNYLIRRFLTGLVTLFGITLVTFSIMRLAPGDPAALQTLGTQNPDAAAESLEKLRKMYLLDRPLHEQYWIWLKRLATADLGNSFSDGRKVSSKILEALWPTVSVAILSMSLAFLIAVPIGVFSAARQGGAFDRIVSTILYMLYSVPSYVLGMLMILYVSVKWDLLPFRGMRSDDFEQLGPLGQLWDYARHYVMITVCFGLGSLAYYSRFVRQNLLEVIREDYIRTARAKGLTETRVLWKHAFVNSLIPFITLVGLTFPTILSGSVILEYLFNWPGLGRLFFESLLSRDYPTIMGLSFMTAVLVLAAMLLADLAYGLVDPRVSYD